MNGQLWKASNQAIHHMIAGVDPQMYAEFCGSYTTMHRGSRTFYSHAAHLSTSIALPQLLAMDDVEINSQ